MRTLITPLLVQATPIGLPVTKSTANMSAHLRAWEQRYGTRVNIGWSEGLAGLKEENGLIAEMYIAATTHRRAKAGGVGMQTAAGSFARPRGGGTCNRSRC